MKRAKLLTRLALLLMMASVVISMCAGEKGRAASACAVCASLALFACASYLRAPKASFGFSKAGGARDGRTQAPGLTFTDVAANENARASLMELRDFLKQPEKFSALGARIPHGVLLYGPPGTGKTLLARALAGEAGVPFLAMNGSDFVEMYVGVGASRVRDVFKRARKFGKCVIFIDEIDSLGRSRGANSSDERDQTLNALLSEMSGFKPSDGVIVIAATNRAEMLDSALLRPGRFDRRIEVGMPGKDERLSILKLHSKNKPVGESVNLAELAAQTLYFSGASLENLMNEAAIRAARRDAKTIENCDVQAAYLCAVAGEEKRGPRKELEISQIALHEAGHAVAMRALLPNNQLRRISIVPSSGGAAGYNLAIPEEKALFSKREMESQICVLLAGRAAEALVFGEDGVTGGASNDLKRAAELTAAMVNELGMGGDMALSMGTLTRLLGGGDALSSGRALLDKLFQKTLALLQEKFSVLVRVSRALRERESLDAREIDEIFEDAQTPVSNELQKSGASAT